MADTIADMLTTIKNAGAVGKETVNIPYSRLKMSIAEILLREGFINDVSRKGKKNKKVISISLKYDKEGKPFIKEAIKISRQSKRVYLPYRQIRKGRGIKIISTNKGLMTDKEARDQKVGGEVICEII